LLLLFGGGVGVGGMGPSEGADVGGTYGLEGAGEAGVEGWDGAGEGWDGAGVGASVVFGAMVGLSVVTLDVDVDVGANVGAGDMVVALLLVGAAVVVGATVSFPGTTTVGDGETVVVLSLSDDDEGALGTGDGPVVAFSCAELRDRRRRKMEAHLITLFNEDTILALFL
jgi:hypothetical protein